MAHTGEKKIQVNGEERPTDQPEMEGAGHEGRSESAAIPGEEDLLKDLDEARNEVVEHRDRLMRLAAEFENYKKRMERECATTLKYAEEQILRELLPGMDNLERALEQGRTTHNIESLLEGVEMTRHGLLETLKKFGVTPVASAGETFDPNFHEAVAMEESNDVAANTILSEFQKGYLYKDRLLRPAKVIVSKGPSSNG